MKSLKWTSVTLNKHTISTGRYFDKGRIKFNNQISMVDPTSWQQYPWLIICYIYVKYIQQKKVTPWSPLSNGGNIIIHHHISNFISFSKKIFTNANHLQNMFSKWLNDTTCFKEQIICITTSHIIYFVYLHNLIQSIHQIQLHLKPIRMCYDIS